MSPYSDAYKKFLPGSVCHLLMNEPLSRRKAETEPIFSVKTLLRKATPGPKELRRGYCLEGIIIKIAGRIGQRGDDLSGPCTSQGRAGGGSCYPVSRTAIY